MLDALKICEFQALTSVIHMSLYVAGLPDVADSLILPLATGMGILMTLNALRLKKPDAKYILWPRVDQPTAFKAMCTGGQNIDMYIITLFDSVCRF